MTDVEKAEALLEIVRDELNLKEIVLFTGHNHDPNDEDLFVQVRFSDKKLRMYKNGVEVPAPKSVAKIAEGWLNNFADQERPV